LTLSVGTAMPAAAEDDGFYAGKQISLLIGGAVGGGYDAQARLMARHLGHFIPGHPNIVPQNMPGGAGLAATNQIYNVAAKDGTVMALVQRSMLLVKSWNPSGVRFELGKLNWIGSMSSEVAVTLAWHTAPYKTLQDLFDKELIVGGVAGGDPDTTARLLNATIGTKFKVINGYNGTTEIALAMERGELQGIADWSWSSLKKARPDWLRDKKVTLLLQTAMQKDPDLGDLPLARDFVKSDTDRATMDLYLTQKTVARPVIAPPGIPASRMAMLRASFAAMAKDAEFLADAERTGIDVTPITGDVVDRAIAVVTSASPEAIERLGKATKAPEK
jgi:tripartite-type tricarboxylate transporter receptor subunit TctC